MRSFFLTRQIVTELTPLIPALYFVSPIYDSHQCNCFEHCGVLSYLGEESLEINNHGSGNVLSESTAFENN
jgi:hypothetical protein